MLVCNSAFAGKKRTPGTQRPYVIKNRTYYPLPSADGYVESGIASWYGRDFHGRLTSNGEKYNMHDITAAHKLLPMHTMLLVQNRDNGRKIVVRVNDRGPFIQGRIIDLSYGAAKKLGLVNTGTARVTITALGEVQNKSSSGNIVFKEQADLRSGEYYVQIGAFLKKYNALELQDKFSKSHHKAIIRKAQVNGKLFYRVHVYVGQTLNNARRSEKALLSKGYRGAFIIAL
jgi:rare lipoprotein A